MSPRWSGASASGAEGLPLDRRADIFAYGVVLWEMLAGQRLYPGGNQWETGSKISNI